MSNELIAMAIIAVICYKIGVFIGKYGHLTIPQLLEKFKND